MLPPLGPLGEALRGPGLGMAPGYRYLEVTAITALL
jgi:hypothetical protein